MDICECEIKSTTAGLAKKDESPRPSRVNIKSVHQHNHCSSENLPVAGSLSFTFALPVSAEIGKASESAIATTLRIEFIMSDGREFYGV